MKETRQEKLHTIKLPPFRVKANTLIDFIDKLASASEDVKLTLTEDDGRAKITLEEIQEIRDNIYRIQTPFTVTLGNLKLNASDRFVSNIDFYDSDKKRAYHLQSFLCEQTPWYVIFSFFFFQKYYILKMSIGILAINIPLYWFNNFFIALAISIAWFSFLFYSMLLEFYARPRIIHRETGSWLERNKDPLLVYSIVTAISATLSNLDRISAFLQVFTNQ